MEHKDPKLTSLSDINNGNPLMKGTFAASRRITLDDDGANAAQEDTPMTTAAKDAEEIESFIIIDRSC
jgi:hypothetical protein